jgi:hypothetical protein
VNHVVFPPATDAARAKAPGRLSDEIWRTEPSEDSQTPDSTPP